LKKHIPNFITLLNLFCGCIATLHAVNGNMIYAVFFVFLGIFFDFFDGLLARQLNVKSELGLQLDSLADMVTSGLVPGLVMFHLISLTVDEEVMHTNLTLSELVSGNVSFLPYVGLFITLASAYRLAKFNIATNQTNNFIGLPTPANALLILSLPVILEFQNNDFINSIILNQWFLIFITLLSSFLLNANLKLIAFKKLTTTSFRENIISYLFLFLAVIVLVVFKFVGIPLVIVIYIAFSILSYHYFNNK